MSSRLRIATAGGIQSIGLVLKAGYIGGMGGITPTCNANAFLSTPFGWFCPRLVSLLAWQNVPPLALLNVGRCKPL